jgi:hypothetical protein
MSITPAALIAICGGLILAAAIFKATRHRIYLTVSGSVALGVVLLIIVLAGSH